LKLGGRQENQSKRQLLTPAMKQKRLEWANKYRSCTTDVWTKVAFSDKSHFLFRVTEQALSHEAVMN
jgi:sulfur transfer protein SufE